MTDHYVRPRNPFVLSEAEVQSEDDEDEDEDELSELELDGKHFLNLEFLKLFSGYT